MSVSVWRDYFWLASFNIYTLTNHKQKADYDDSRQSWSLLEQFTVHQ